MQPQRPRRRPPSRIYMPWDFFRPRSQRPPPPRPPETYRQNENVPRPAQRSRSPLPTRPPSYPPSQAYRPSAYNRPTAKQRKIRFPIVGCLFSLACLGALGVVLAAYLFWPGRSNILLLGIDYADPYNWLARTDTIVITTFIPSENYIGMVSIPRDLWVNIPGVGENRINTAHFYGEAEQPWSGPYYTIATIQENFGVTIDYHARIRFEGFKDVVNALGGVDITLTEPTAGYEPGSYHLTGNKALAFVRVRMDSDDFHRMEHGQLMMKALVKTLLKPKNWIKIPAIYQAVRRNITTDIPTWMWPRLAFAIIWTGPDNIDNRVIKDDMVSSFMTSEGAAVLAPNWDLILPLAKEMFGE